MIPGLFLQGIGLGVVLTVNDPVGMNAVDESDRGEAAGLINTTEQMGGAIGIAVLSAIELGVYFPDLYRRLGARGITPTQDQVAEVHQFIVQAEQLGLRHVGQSDTVKATLHDLVAAHVLAFQVTFVAAPPSRSSARQSASSSSQPDRRHRARLRATLSVGRRYPGELSALTRLPPATPGRS